jgi:protein-tyrosine kinase
VSLVEKALKKMQSANAVTTAGAAAPARRVSDTATNLPRPPIVAPGNTAPQATTATPAPVVVSAAPAAPSRESQPLTRTDKVITINHNSLREQGLWPPQEDERRVAAEYRQIKRPLVAAARGRGLPALPNGRVLLVASALPGEGKTYTSINLTFSLALEKDTSVLLVDGDLAKAHVSRVFGVRDEPGLMDALLDDSKDINSLILPTSVRGVSLLPAGRGAETATELLASSRMERIVAELLSRDPSRIVVFDSPPLLLTTESRALTTVAGQIVVVVRAEDTAHKAVTDALRFVASDKPIGLILNQCRSTPTHGYYAYGEYGDSTDSPKSG